MPAAAVATKGMFADTSSVYIGVQPSTAAGNSAISSKYTNQFNSAFTAKAAATAADSDCYDDDDYTAVEAVSASDWRTKADSTTRQPSELTRSLSEQLIAASRARLAAQQQQQRSGSIDSVISLNSSCSSNRSSSSSSSSVDAAKAVAAAVAANSSEVCVIDDDDISSNVSADVCSDVDDCITGLQPLQQISTRQSSTIEHMTARSNAQCAQQYASNAISSMDQ
jgi:hypothetical protein